MKKIIFCGMFAFCSFFGFAQENSCVEATALPKIIRQKNDVATYDDLAASIKAESPFENDKSFEKEIGSTWAWTIFSIVAEGEYRSMINDKSVQEMMRTSGLQNQ